ncbi:hypothetical protein KAR48_09755 [bacterium]|nr:hypothetical protein [bacterium]
MKKQFFPLVIMLFLLLLLGTACEDYVTSTDPLIDRVEDQYLTEESQVPFIISGVKAKFSAAIDHLFTMAGVLSDEMFFDVAVVGATYPDFDSFNRGEMRDDMTHIAGPYNDIGELRFMGDDLIRRLESLEFEDADLANEAAFVANFYGGAFPRYLLAGYWALARNQPGGTIDNSAFIAAGTLYADAIEKAKTALTFTSDAVLIRTVNTFIARVYLFQGSYALAAQHAALGLVEGDAPFEALYSLVGLQNTWYHNAGRGRCNGAAAWRLSEYIEADANEANRLPLTNPNSTDGILYWMQDKYPSVGSPIHFLTWQETSLILAECALRGAGGGDALALVNSVRAFYSIDALAQVDMEVLIVERDKQLAFTGMRLIDQRRFDDAYGTWHLGDEAWRYFIIPNDERNGNPNI